MQILGNSRLTIGGVPIKGSSFAAPSGFKSDPIRMNGSRYSLTVWSDALADAGATGSMTVQASDDPADSPAENSFGEVPGAAQAVVPASLVPLQWNDVIASYAWIRLVYTPTSGTLKCNAAVTVKG